MTEFQWMDAFGDNLRDILKEKRMTQRELADEAGLSESTISDYLHKKKMPGLRAVINMAFALDMDVDELVYFNERIV